MARRSIQSKKDWDDRDTPRFWKYVDKTNDCWEWTSNLDRKGYGRFRKQVKGLRKNYGAHRISYILNHGAIIDNLCVLHKCDNPPCVNPEHLFLGTQQDNIRDAVNKERMASGDNHYARRRPELVKRGEDSHNSKISQKDVDIIRHLYKKGNILQKELATKFGISFQQVSRIIRNERWVSI